jgi:hypothetical protein
MKLFRELEFADGRIIRLPYSPFGWGNSPSMRFGPLAIPLLLAGTGLMAAGQIQAGRAAAAEGKSAQNIANYNAAVMEQQAKAERAAGEFKQVRQAEAGERIKSSMQAALGKAGGGPQLLPESEQAAELELENLMIGYESELTAKRAESQAELDRLQGKLYKQKGRNLATASYLGAGSTLLTGLGVAGYLSNIGVDKGATYYGQSGGGWSSSPT